MESPNEGHRLGSSRLCELAPKSSDSFEFADVAKMIEWELNGIITDDPVPLISMLALPRLPFDRPLLNVYAPTFPMIRGSDFSPATPPDAHAGFANYVNTR